ncbi:YceI family protein [Chitinophagaceae bacterium LB-8]|uniref:YceI family protein n=1 Tax=Paraflavisolibacter caeni TaxID=2982496 RepID=A0A9X2XXX0_9BACT|nr:YceI family protein [Paraflavisolibacter caeni]MCU7551584.1 YceI family protein [Paraflavisolibacter caeni]
MANTKWIIDAAHSEVLFKVKHLMVTNVTGQFSSFEGTVEAENDDFSNATIQFTADVHSISTNNEQRDQHLKTADFFEAEKYPQVKFVSTGFKKKSDEDYELTGDLTIKGITQQVSLKVEFSGIVQDPWGNTKAGFSLNGKINRKDFGLTFNAVTETGGVLLSDEVKLLAEVQLQKQAEVAQAA